MNGGQSPLTLKKVTADFVRHKKVLLKVDYNVPLMLAERQWLMIPASKLRYLLSNF